MSADEETTSVGVAVIFGLILWIIALCTAPVVTGLITFTVILVAGILMTSGGGDGRNGRR